MLGPDGLLPTGGHYMTLEQVLTHFVDAFPGSATRAGIYARWLEHRQAIQAVIPIERQLVDGSFMTAKLDPGDIDVVTVLDGPTYDALTPGQQALLDPLFDGHGTRDVWRVDSFMVPTYPDGHPMGVAARRLEGSYKKLWTQVKNVSGVYKGYVEVGA